MDMSYSPDGTESGADYLAARLFLSDLAIEADIFTDPRRSEEWLGVMENLYHTLLSLEAEWAPVKDPATTPPWFSGGPIGQFFARFIQCAAVLPLPDLQQLDIGRKLGLHATLVGALVLACSDISAARSLTKGK